MATQKAALVGCKEGPWVSTARMRQLHLHVKGAEDLLVAVTQRDDQDEIGTAIFKGPGKYPIPDADWARTAVLQGDCSSALCFLVSGNG